MSNVLRLSPWIGVILAALQVAPADAQGNIDAGKSPAQIFGDTCSACHRSPRDLRRTSASFLRTHYTTGSDEASAMANYLANLGSDPRAAQPAAQSKRPPAEISKQNPPPRLAPAEQPKSEQPKSEQPRAAQAQPKAKASPTAQVRPAPPEERPLEPPAAASVTPPAPPAPVLEPFEE